MFINYADETIYALDSAGNYSIEDIDWIGTSSFTIPIDEFFEAARNTNYNSGYGSVATPMDIVIFMKDGCWFERKEYDGSEWWAYRKPYVKPQLCLHLESNTFESNYYDPMLHMYCVRTNEQSIYFSKR